MASDCKVKDLTSLRREIRALLISSKHGCTPKQLENDYLQVMGECVPYHYLGYSSFMSFIYSIPDVVSVCRSRNNVVLYGIADKSTKKIKDMVSKQRSKRDHGSFTPCASMCTKNFKPSPRKPAVPPAFQTCLKELMLSHPNGIALKFFDEAFAKRFHHYICFQNWGFDSLESMIESVPEILRIHNDTTRNIKMVKRVNSEQDGFVDSQVSPKKHGINWFSLEENRHQPSQRDVEVKQGQRPVEGGAKHRSGRENKKKQPYNNGKPESLHSLEELSPPQMKKRLLEDIKAPPVPSDKTESSKKSVPWAVMSKVKSLLVANKSGIWVSRFLMEYKERFKQDLDVKALGYTSVAHMLHAIPCCAIEKPGGSGDWLVYLKGMSRPNIGTGHKYHGGAYVSEELAKAVHRTLDGHDKDGLLLHEFPKKFKEVNELDFPMEEMGFTSTAELLQRVDGVEMKRPPTASSVMVFKTASAIEEEEKKEKEDQVSLKKKEMLAAQPSVYKQVDLPEPSATKFQSVYVTEVTTPSKMVVQLIGKETTQVLECLQEDMTHFYRSHEGKSFTIEETYPGQPCCASFNNDGCWYRAEVEDMVCSDIVRVRYVDYGNTAKLPLSSIRRPKLNHLILPAQAVECRLCHLKPAGGTWSIRANQLLKQMTKDLPLVAVVTAVKNRLMSLCLVDTSTSRDVYINDALVQQGLALFMSDTVADEMGVETYSLEGPLPGGDGKSVPRVRLPKEPYKPPTSVPLSLPSEHLFSLQQQPKSLPTPAQQSVTTPTPSVPTPSVPTPPVAMSNQPTATPLQPAATPLQPAATPLQPAATPLQPAAMPLQPAAMPLQPAAMPFQPAAAFQKLNSRNSQQTVPQVAPNPHQTTPILPTFQYPQAMSAPYPVGPLPQPLPQPLNFWDLLLKQQQQQLYSAMRGHAPSQMSWQPRSSQPGPGHPPQCSTPHPNMATPYQSVPYYGHAQQPRPVVPPPPGHAPLANMRYPSCPLMPLGPPSGKVFQFGVPPPGHAPLSGDRVPPGHTQDHVTRPLGHAPQHNGAHAETKGAVAVNGTGTDTDVESGVAGVMGTDEMLDAISTPSSSDSEEDIAESAVVAKPGLSELQERKRSILQKMSEGSGSGTMATLLLELTAVLKDITISESSGCPVSTYAQPLKESVNGKEEPVETSVEGVEPVQEVRSEEDPAEEVAEGRSEPVSVVEGRSEGDDGTVLSPVEAGADLSAETVGSPSRDDPGEMRVVEGHPCTSVRVRRSSVSPVCLSEDEWPCLEDLEKCTESSEEWDLSGDQDTVVMVEDSKDMLEDQDTVLEVTEDQDTVLEVTEDQDTVLEVTEDQDTVLEVTEDQDTVLEVVEDQDTVLEVVEDQDTVLEVTEDQDTVLEVTEDQDTVLEVTEDQDTVLEDQDTVLESQDTVLGAVLEVAEDQDTILGDWDLEDQDTVLDKAENQDMVTDNQDTISEVPEGEEEGTEVVKVELNISHEDTSIPETTPATPTGAAPATPTSLVTSTPISIPSKTVPTRSILSPEAKPFFPAVAPSSTPPSPSVPSSLATTAPLSSTSAVAPSSLATTAPLSSTSAVAPSSLATTAPLSSTSAVAPSSLTTVPSPVSTTVVTSTAITVPPSLATVSLSSLTTTFAIPPSSLVISPPVPSSPITAVTPSSLTTTPAIAPSSLTITPAIAPSSRTTIPAVSSNPLPLTTPASAPPVDKRPHPLPTPSILPAPVFTTPQGVRVKRKPVGLGRGLSGPRSRRATSCGPGGLSVLYQDPKSSANMHLL